MTCQNVKGYKIAPKTPTIEELVVSLRLENEQLTLMMIMERILPFQYKTYWKKYDLKNVLKKEIF